jgi:hypothetical protein
VIYASLSAVSAVAEAIKSFRGRILQDGFFARPDGMRVALSAYRLDEGLKWVDFNAPENLVKWGLTPASMATFHRPATQAIARRLYDGGLAGFQWWSTLESRWVNMTLFEDRVKKHLRPEGPPAPLGAGLPEVREAARMLSVGLKN